MKLITAELNRKFGACYADARLAELYGEGKTVREVATLRDGPWSDVSDGDRLWILMKVLIMLPKYYPAASAREVLARLVERALAAVKNPDPRSVAVIAAFRANRVTKEVRAAAAYAAYAAYAYAYAYAAAYAAYDERRRILADIVECMGRDSDNQIIAVKNDH